MKLVKVRNIFVDRHKIVGFIFSQCLPLILSVKSTDNFYKLIDSFNLLDFAPILYLDTT